MEMGFCTGGSHFFTVPVSYLEAYVSRCSLKSLEKSIAYYALRTGGFGASVDKRPQFWLRMGAKNDTTRYP